MYALLGSLARINDLVSEEYQDTSIAAVARRLRNAIFKQHIAVEAVVSRNNASFYEMANSWIQFLEKIAKKSEVGFFIDAEAVLRTLGFESLNLVFHIGKTLDIVAKDDAEFWDIIAENIDVAKSEKSIELMLDYGDMRGSKDEIISTAARNFYWAIMGSELVALHEASKRGNREARMVLKRERFKPLLPYLPEFRDRGVFARHPSAILKENHQVLHALLAFESADKPLVAKSRTRLNPKAVIFSPEGVCTQIILGVNCRKNYPENCNLPLLNVRMIQRWTFTELKKSDTLQPNLQKLKPKE